MVDERGWWINEVCTQYMLLIHFFLETRQISGVGSLALPAEQESGRKRQTMGLGDYSGRNWRACPAL